jgi:hypothetical protein
MPLKIFNPRHLLELIYEAMDRTGLTQREAARRMGGIDPKYLSRQVNPDDPGAKMGIEDFVYFSAVTDLEALNYIEAAFNRVAFDIPQTGTEPAAAEWWQSIAKISKEAGESVSAIAEALANDNYIDSKERQICRNEILDAIRALAAAWYKLQ